MGRRRSVPCRYIQSVTSAQWHSWIWYEKVEFSSKVIWWNVWSMESVPVWCKAYSKMSFNNGTRVYSCWLGLRATDHLLPENPDNNCFIIPHFLELCSMMNGQAPDKMIHYTTQNVITFRFFLSLMNHFSRQITNAIAYKITDFFLLQATQPVLSAKVSQNDAYFRHAHGRFFFFGRSSNDCSIAPRYSFSMPSWQYFCVVTVPVIKNYIYFLFRSASNHLLGVRNDRRHL